MTPGVTAARPAPLAEAPPLARPPLAGAPWRLAAAALAVVVAFLVFMLAATEGRFVAQVTDLYLVAQYAKAMAEGHPFRFNPGDPPTTGATSLLHTALLAAAHALGARGEGLIAFAILSGAVFYVLTVLVAARIGARLGGPREAALAGLLVAFGGPVVWGFLYGSDIALTMLLATWLLERMLAGWHRRDRTDGGWVAAAALLAVARPEGLLAGLVLGAAFVAGPGRGQPRRGGLRPWLPAAAGLSVLAVYRLATGRWLGSSMADKSLLANYSLSDAVAVVAEYAVDVARGVLLGFYPPEASVGGARGFAAFYFPPLALVLVLLAVALARPPHAAPLRTWSAVVLALFVAVAPNTFLGVHFNRYLMWAFPALLALAAVGLGILIRRLALSEPARERPLWAAFGALFVGLGVLSTARFAGIYADMAGEVSRRDLAAAQWIRQSLPPGVVMANLVTSVEYLTGHRGVNLHGVTSPAFFGNRAAEREANTLEALARLPEGERPPYLISSLSRQEAWPSLRELVEEPPLFRTASLGDEIVIHRMRYDILARGRESFAPQTAAAVQGLELVDRLNVCDSRDEAAHRYRVRSRLGNLWLHGTARVDEYAQGPRVADAGRVVLGHESFEVRTRPGRALVVVLRTSSSATARVMRPGHVAELPLELAEAGMVVTVDGQGAGRWGFAPRPGWDEQAFRVPASLVRAERTRLELRGRYAAFYYWFYQ